MLRFYDEPIFNSLHWPKHHYYYSVFPRKTNIWSTSIPIAGYEPSEVTIKEEKNENGEVKIIVQAKREKEEDYAEFRKAVNVPDNVDHENLKSKWTNEGLLILKAPYKDSLNCNGQPIKINRVDKWNGIWEELDSLRDQMNNLIDVHGIVNAPITEYITSENDESGTWRIRINIGKDFKSEDIKLCLLNNQVHLEAKKLIKTDRSTSSRFVNEIISIPDGIEKDKIRSRLMDSGQLIVEAPCHALPSIEKNNVGKPILVEVEKSEDS